MEDFPSRKGECQETSGFLFSHRCGQFATSRCAKCGKDVCDRHAVRQMQRVYCTTCGKEDRPARPGRPARGYYDDPYYYADDYYPDYHRDRDDFTESDEAAVAGGGIAASELGTFEDDMGGS